MVGGDQELGVEDGALGVGALGTVGKLRQISLPGRDGLGEFLLPLEDLADVKRGRHGELGPVAAGHVGLDLEAVFLEELGIGIECIGALAAGAIRFAEKEGRTHGLRMSRERRQEPPKGRDALAQAGVVGRIGDAIGRCDLIKGVGTNGGDDPWRLRPAFCVRCRGPDRSR